MEGYLSASLGAVHSVQLVTCFSKVVTVYIVKADLVNDDSSVYVAAGGGLTSQQSQAARFDDRLSASSLVLVSGGFRVVKLVPRRG